MTQTKLFLKTLATSLQETLEIPMWGKTPEFPWDQLESTLKEGLGVDDITLKPLFSDWKTKETLLDGFDPDVQTYSFSMAPLSAPFHLLLGKQDLEILIQSLVTQDEKRSFSDEVFQKGFTKFFILNLLRGFDKISPFQGLKARLCDKPVVKENAYLVDISLKFGDKEILPRILLPESFHRVLTSHFSSKAVPIHHLDQSLQIDTSLEIGKVSLTHTHLKELEVGDFIILDECSYQPKTHQGTLSLVLGSSILFVLKRKHEELKILDYGLFNLESNYQEGNPMEEDFESTEDQNIEFEDETSLEGSTFNDEAIEKVISSTQVPLLLKVEVGKLSLSLSQLLSLKPGNTLPLGHSLDQGVNITLNSKIIAKGDLIQLGDVIGVKINQISS